MNSPSESRIRANDMVSYRWPTPSGRTESPFWTGHGFKVGSDNVAVLSYEGDSSGWTDELTSFHEDAAGATHPIDRASRHEAIDQLQRHVSTAYPIILEIGCSSGFMLRELAKKMPQAALIGADYVRGPLQKLALEMPDIPLMRFDLTRCPLPAESLDAVIALNVLEHIRDDQTAAAEIHRILKPGGVAVIEVPAGPRLFDSYDELLLHHRRYSLDAAVRLFENVGFEVLRRSHLGFFVYPMFWLTKQRNKWLVTEQKLSRDQVVETQIRRTSKSNLLDLSLRMELSLGRWISYPFGIRCLLTCRKRAGRAD